MSIRHRLGYWLLGWPHVTDASRMAAQEEVQSIQCACGEVKTRGNPFCAHCWVKLPRLSKRKLRRMLRRGFVIEYNRVHPYSLLRKLDRERVA